MQRLPNIQRRQIALLGLSAALAGTAWAPSAMAAKRRTDERLTAFRGTAVGTVTAVDVAAHRLTVRARRGEARFRADPRKVQTLETFKVGDTVRVDYVAGIGIKVQRGDEAAAAAPAPPAAKPAEGGEPIQAVLRVLAIDRAGQTVRLQGPKGETGNLPVQDKADLIGLQVGDKVTVVIYELVAVKVEPAPK